MTWAHLILLAIVQGLTEFLPVSSSAHLILAPRLLGLPDQGALIDLAVHVGSLGAVIVHFWRDLRALAGAGLGALFGRPSAEGRRAWLFVAATLPALIVGFALLKLGWLDALRDPILIAWATIIFGLLLWAADKLIAPRRVDSDFRLRDAALIGVAQAFALAPGVSRSGACVTAARALGFDRIASAKIAMLLAVPTILAAGAAGALELAETGAPALWGQAAAAALASFLAAWIGIGGFLWIAARTDLTVFVIYRLLLGVAILALA